MEPHNQTTPIQNIQIRPKTKSRKRNYCIILIIILFVLFLLFFVLPILILSLNGTFKNAICENISSNNAIYTKLDCSNVNTSSKTTFEQDNTINLDKSKISTQEDLITQIVDKASPAVVTVAASTALNPDAIANGIIDDTQQNIGSGFIVRSDGVIVTNSHVVSDETLEYSIIISSEKKPIPATKIYRDTASDIAIIKIDKTNLPTLKLGDSDTVKQGNTVVAIGSPLGDLTGSVTSGIISGLNRDVTAGGGSAGTERIQGVIQTDAAINPGNSGGPLINSNGEVIGINFATTTGASNISFTIPVNRVKAKLLEYQNYGRLLQPYIGIAFVQRTFYLTDNTLSGALLSQVQAGTPAEKAGLLKGDIILKANDKDLATESLQNIIQSSKVGDTLKMNVWRKGQKIDINVVVGDKSATPATITPTP